MVSGYNLLAEVSALLIPRRLGVGFLVAAALLLLGAHVPANAVPVANFSRSPATGNPPLEVRFDASASQAPGGRIVTYQWSYGDGYSGSGMTPTHRYAADGTYTVTLVVRDDQRGQDIRSCLIHVSGPAEVFPFGTKIGQAAPTFELADLGGTPVRLTDLRGQVVLLEFWVTTCAACTRSLPALAALRDRYQDKGVVLVGVTIDRKAQDAANFLANAHLNITCLWGSQDASRAVMTLYGVEQTPHLFLIDRIGVIRYSTSSGDLSSKDIEPWL